MAKYQKTSDTEEPVAEPLDKSLFDRVDAYLTANEWNYTANEEKRAFYYGLHLKDSNSRVVLEVAEKGFCECILVYTIYPFFVPEHRRALMTDALNRINHALAIVSFEMDPADGEVRIRSFIEADEKISETFLDRYLNLSYRNADRFQAALLSVAFGNATPDVVMEMASRTDESKLQ